MPERRWSRAGWWGESLPRLPSSPAFLATAFLACLSSPQPSSSPGFLLASLPRHSLPRHSLPRHSLPRHSLPRHSHPSLLAFPPQPSKPLALACPSPPAFPRLPSLACPPSPAFSRLPSLACLPRCLPSLACLPRMPSSPACPRTAFTRQPSRLPFIPRHSLPRHLPALACLPSPAFPRPASLPSPAFPRQHFLASLPFRQPSHACLPLPASPRQLFLSCLLSLASLLSLCDCVSPVFLNTRYVMCASQPA